jgi:hypothetical protein
MQYNEEHSHELQSEPANAPVPITVLPRSGSNTPLEQSKAPFNLEYGFWAVMGGFVVDTRSIHDTVRRLTLSPAGI